jgi:hypothetical protein
MEEWINRTDAKKHQLLKISTTLFDEAGRLKVINPTDWNDEWVSISELKPDDDDIPF